MKTKMEARKRRLKASSNDVLGRPDGAKVNPKWRRHYERLLELRDSLRFRKGELRQAARDEQPAYSLHMADAGTDQYDQDFALSMISSEQSALYEIEQALNRIRGGTYGICELTGEPIEAARLQAIPWTRFCLKAQHELEGKGVTKRPHLPQPGSVTAASAAPETETDEAED